MEKRPLYRKLTLATLLLLAACGQPTPQGDNVGTFYDKKGNLLGGGVWTPKGACTLLHVAKAIIADDGGEARFGKVVKPLRRKDITPIGDAQPDEFGDIPVCTPLTVMPMPKPLYSGRLAPGAKVTINTNRGDAHGVVNGMTYEGDYKVKVINGSVCLYDIGSGVFTSSNVIAGLVQAGVNPIDNCATEIIVDARVAQP